MSFLFSDLKLFCSLEFCVVNIFPVVLQELGTQVEVEESSPVATPAEIPPPVSTPAGGVSLSVSQGTTTVAEGERLYNLVLIFFCQSYFQT